MPLYVFQDKQVINTQGRTEKVVVTGARDDKSFYTVQDCLPLKNGTAYNDSWPLTYVFDSTYDNIFNSTTYKHFYLEFGTKKSYHHHHSVLVAYIFYPQDCTVGYHLQQQSQ
jgi:hypothetical protein